VSVLDAREISESRRRHLVALAAEVEGRGLRWRLAGSSESVLGVVDPFTRRRAMVVATPVADGWSYLWTGGGIADVDSVAEVADALACLLG
jgi:hypothetical protein